MPDRARARDPGIFLELQSEVFLLLQMRESEPARCFPFYAERAVQDFPLPLQLRFGFEYLNPEFEG